MFKKVMILEDDEATAELIKFYLQEEGFQVAHSSKGEGFVEKVIEYQPDLITLDVLLPDTNGFSVMRELQEDTRTRDIPVVFITVIEEDLEKGIKMGARGYVVKPFKEDELKGTIMAILGRERLNEKDSHC
jgi:DNA-binding response OmpR family regulator